jgi:chemotaxis methyl-accepting protein methylase
MNLTPATDTPVLPAEPTVDLLAEDGSFLRWLFAQAGLDVRAYRPESLRRRLPACLRAVGARSLGQARQLLEQSPALVQTALNAMLVGVTAFFRDPAVFAALRDQVFPTLAKQRSSLWVWSVGCSDGAELYSIGMILAELDLLGHSYLLGVDCRSEAIARARAGCFDASALREVPGALRLRWFTEQALGVWQVCPALRAALRWRTADVLTAAEPGLWDVILCRNTAMYLRTEPAQALWERLAQALWPGGVLVVGKAERPTGVKRLVPVGSCLYQRVRGSP